MNQHPEPNREDRAEREGLSVGREILLDQASLQILGALDPAEEEAFLARLDAAAPSLRREVIERQAGWATDPLFRSPAPPPPGLRSKVVAAVVAASEAPVSSARRDLADASEASPNFALRTIIEQLKSQQEVAIRHRAAPWLWRAATLVLGAGLLVSAWFQVRMSEQVSEVAALALQRQTDSQLRELIGSGFDRFLSARTRVTGLAGNGGSATLYFDPALGDGFLLTLGLSDSGGPFTLRAVDCCGDDGTRSVLTFDPQDAVAGFRISAEQFEGLQGAKFEIVDASGDVVLRTL